MTNTQLDQKIIPLHALLQEVVTLRNNVIASGEALLRAWPPCIQRTTFQAAARNLASYVALRCSDLRPL
jgi:pyruvate kinase